MLSITMKDKDFVIVTLLHFQESLSYILMKDKFLGIHNRYGKWKFNFDYDIISIVYETKLVGISGCMHWIMTTLRNI